MDFINSTYNLEAKDATDDYAIIIINKTNVKFEVKKGREIITANNMLYVNTLFAYTLAIASKLNHDELDTVNDQICLTRKECLIESLVSDIRTEFNIVSKSSRILKREIVKTKYKDAVLSFIKDSTRSKKEISNQFRCLKKSERDEIILQLIEENQIEVITEKTKGRPIVIHKFIGNKIEKNEN